VRAHAILTTCWRSKLVWTAAVWVAAGVALAFFDRPLWDTIWVLTLGLWALYAGWGLTLFAIVSWLGWRRGRLPAVLSSIATFIILGVGLALTLPHVAAAGDEFQFSRRFSKLRPQYEAIVARVASATPRQGGEFNGVQYDVDAGPPLRVAFRQPGGIIDNWEGVVWDPSGVVRSAKGWRNGTYTASPEAKALFGGDLVACRHVADHFYRCWFT
jgi:hypothetical protein